MQQVLPRIKKECKALWVIIPNKKKNKVLYSKGKPSHKKNHGFEYFFFSFSFPQGLGSFVQQVPKFILSKHRGKQGYVQQGKTLT
jgi:hypothetical protein